MDAKCRGCGGYVLISRVNPGEDDITPWRVRVTPPRNHVVLSIIPGLAHFQCQDGATYAVETPEITDYHEDVDVAVVESFSGTMPARGYHLGRPPGLIFPYAPRGAPDHVDHETWLEYYNRLIKKYYDFDAEWALIKKICPEVEKAVPAPKPRRVRRARRPRLHPFHGSAVAFLGVAILNYTLGNIVLMAIWAVSALFMLAAATVATTTRR